jgi:hypothetical protein
VNVDNLGFSPGTQGLVAGLVALQQANGLDFDTAVARVRATAESGPLLVANPSWDEVVAMLRWFATPPTPPTPPADVPST